ncbi:hypothetical protein HPB47_004478 [Ixodes persulcatus]|uniref:Uncharacterized protein n=1 Tax=Ixodes persulcatus TaxID=34615 RepID=A0AC60PFV8_IXOPE|nr:hypothetical protein HPB47_004478 [Ixodes persulcatus]
MPSTCADIDIANRGSQGLEISYHRSHPPERQPGSTTDQLTQREAQAATGSGSSVELVSSPSQAMTSETPPEAVFMRRNTSSGDHSYAAVSPRLHRVLATSRHKLQKARKLLKQAKKKINRKTARIRKLNTLLHFAKMVKRLNKSLRRVESLEKHEAVVPSMKVDIGNGVLVEQGTLSGLKSASNTATKYARHLLKTVFTRDELKGKSLRGKKSNAYKEAEVKEALDPVRLKAVLESEDDESDEPSECSDDDKLYPVSSSLSAAKFIAGTVLTG